MAEINKDGTRRELTNLNVQMIALGGRHRHGTVPWVRQYDSQNRSFHFVRISDRRNLFLLHAPGNRRDDVFGS